MVDDFYFIPKEELEQMAVEENKTVEQMKEFTLEIVGARESDTDPWKIDGICRVIFYSEESHKGMQTDRYIRLMIIHECVHEGIYIIDEDASILDNLDAYTSGQLRDAGVCGHKVDNTNNFLNDFLAWRYLFTYGTLQTRIMCVVGLWPTVVVTIFNKIRKNF